MLPGIKGNSEPHGLIDPSANFVWSWKMLGDKNAISTKVRLTNIWTCDFHFLHALSKTSRTQRNHFWLVFGWGGTSESPMLKLKWSFGYGSKPWYLVNIKIAGKWMFIPLKMDDYRYWPMPISRCLKNHHLLGYWIRTFVGLVSYRSYTWAICTKSLVSHAKTCQNLRMTWGVHPQISVASHAIPCKFVGHFSAVLMVCFCWAYPLIIQWIGLRENLQEKPTYNRKTYGFL